MPLYRIFPVLWTSPLQENVTVYAIDRLPAYNTFATACSVREKNDPSYYYENSHFYRLLPPTDSAAYVSWSTLPSWISFVANYGYAMTANVSQLNPQCAFYIEGP